MRKKTINHLADTIFWYLLYFLPILLYLLYFLSGAVTDSNFLSFDMFFDKIGFDGIMGYNAIYDVLWQLFGFGGANHIFPLFSETGVFLFLTWFASVYIMHLAVDFLIFIPRLCHKWLKGFTKGD